MATPGCTAPCAATDVVAGSTITCSTVKLRDKFNAIETLVTSLKDKIYPCPKPQEEGTAPSKTLSWNVPIGECGITTTEVTTTTPNQIHHVLYLNPSANSGHVMHQVKLTCKHDVVIDERMVFKIES